MMSAMSTTPPTAPPIAAFVPVDMPPECDDGESSVEEGKGESVGDGPENADVAVMPGSYSEG